MKKILLLILIILLMLSMSMALVCCDNSTQEESDDPVVEVEPDDDIVVEDIVPDSPDPDEDTPEDVVPDTSDAIYSVTFDGNGGSEVSEQTLAPGSTATYIEPTREGFTFAGWYSDGSEYAFDSVVYSDTQLTAMWYGTEQDSSGIQYTLDSDCQAYTVVGIDSTASGDIELPSTFMNLPVESIAESAFANNSSIVSIVIPSSVTYIGYGAFSGCSSLVSMTVPYIGESWASSTNCHFGYIFGDDSYLTSSSDSTNVPASLTELTVSNGAVSAYSVQYMTNITTLVLAEGVTTIGHDAFGGCSSLTSVVIEDTVTTIGYRAFYDCGSLTSLVVGSSVSSVGYSAFWGCVQLVQLCNLSDLSLTAGSDDYGYIAYYAIDMFDDVEDIDNTKLSVDDNGYVLYTANDQVVLVAYIGSSSEVVVPSSVTVLSRHAFQYNSVVTSVDTGDVITEITYCTFAGLDNIESVTIGNSVATIGNGAFYGCTNLSSVVLGDSVDTIGELAFYNCGIDSLVIPNSVTVIGYGALLGCNSIESLTIPFVGGSLATSSSTGYLGYIFGDISYRKETFKVLSDTNVPTSLTTLTITCGAIADNALQYMTSITTVVIGDDVTSIGNYAFSGCSKLASVTIGSGVSKIGYCAFSACSNLTTVTIGSSVSSIGVDAFYSCSSMADVYTMEQL